MKRRDPYRRQEITLRRLFIASLCLLALSLIITGIRLAALFAEIAAR